MKHAFAILALAFAGQAALADYEETRDLSVPSAGLETLRIEAGAGSLQVSGAPGADAVTVSARIRVPGASASRAAKVIERDMVLRLDADGAVAQLDSWFESGPSLFGSSPTIDLEVRLPPELSLEIEDGSGSIEIRDMGAAVQVDDGSGSLSLRRVRGPVSIDDGSGSIVVRDVERDVSIRDGSGSITVSRVGGNVRIIDGSGGIDVAEVAGDLDIPKAGSGSVSISEVQGRVSRGD